MYSIPSLRGILSKTGPAPVLGDYPFYANGRVSAQLVVGNSIYIVGGFTAVGSYSDMKTSRFCVLNSTNANANYSSISRTLFNGNVTCSLIVGSYIYVGGTFTAYNSQPCERLAKISLIDGSLNATFNTAIGFSSTINSIALDSSGNLIVGGFFTTYKGIARERIAKLNPTTAALDTTFDTASGFSSAVNSIALDGSGNLIVGGDFTTYKGTTRQYIAKLNPTTAVLDTTFNTASGFNGSVSSIALDSSGNIYAGGGFTTYKGTTRQYISKLNPTTAALDTTFNTASGFSSLVYSIVLDGSGNLIVGGTFSTYKSIARNSIAKLNPTTAVLDTTFNTASGFNGSVSSIALDSSGNIYAGGGFTTYKGTTRQYIAKINATTAALDTTFNTASGFNSSVNSIALDASGNVYVGGGYNNYKTLNPVTTRQGIAKISLVNGSIDTTFDAAIGFNNVVNSIALDGSGNLIVGGAFSSYKGTTRLFIVKLNPTTAALDTTFDTETGFNSSVNSIALDGSGNLIVGGGFTTYKSIARERIAKINATTAALDTTFDTASGFNSSVNSIVLDASGNIYAGGSSITYKSIARQGIAKLNPTTAALDTTFDTASGFNSSVNSIVLDGSGNLIAGGDFGTYKGTARQCIAKINATTAALDTTFGTETGFNSTVRTIALDASGNIYAGGSFTTYKSIARQGIAKLNPTTAVLDTTFDTSTGKGFNSATLFSITFISPNTLYVGGVFTSFSYVTGPLNGTNFAFVNKDTALPVGY